MPINFDLRQPDATATLASIEMVDRIAEFDLSKPTPCAGWDLRALIEHMTTQHRGFAAAARGQAVPPPEASEDLIKAYAEAACDVLVAFEGDILEREFLLPEFGRPVPGRLAVSFHLVDYVVHTWDVAQTIGADFQPDPAVLAPALRVARAVPDGPTRLEPGAPFAPALPIPSDVTQLDEILLLLGRKPR